MRAGNKRPTDAAAARAGKARKAAPKWLTGAVERVGHLLHLHDFGEDQAEVYVLRVGEGDAYVGVGDCAWLRLEDGHSAGRCAFTKGRDVELLGSWLVPEEFKYELELLAFLVVVRQANESAVVGGSFVTSREPSALMGMFLARLRSTLLGRCWICQSGGHLAKECEQKGTCPGCLVRCAACASAAGVRSDGALSLDGLASAEVVPDIADALRKVRTGDVPAVEAVRELLQKKAAQSWQESAGAESGVEWAKNMAETAAMEAARRVAAAAQRGVRKGVEVEKEKEQRRREEAEEREAAERARAAPLAAEGAWRASVKEGQPPEGLTAAVVTAWMEERRESLVRSHDGEDYVLLKLFVQKCGAVPCKEGRAGSLLKHRYVSPTAEPSQAKWRRRANAWKDAHWASLVKGAIKEKRLQKGAGRAVDWPGYEAVGSARAPKVVRLTDLLAVLCKSKKTNTNSKKKMLPKCK